MEDKIDCLIKRSELSNIETEYNKMIEKPPGGDTLNEEMLALFYIK